MNQRIFLFLFTLLLVIQAKSQDSFFSDIAESKVRASGIRTIIPQKFRMLEANSRQLLNFLWSLPSEKNILNRTLTPEIILPLPNGTTQRFHVWESSIQEPGLEAKFPEIRTFCGQGIDDPYATIRLDYNPYFGFHAQVLTINGTFYIDPYSRGDVNHYMSYFRSEYSRETDFVCLTDEHLAARPEGVLAGPCTGTQLRTYRLAIACTGEYAVAVGGTTAALLHAAIVTSANRVTGVYETELSVRLVLVATNNLIEFLSASTDPFTGNNNANTLITESQTQITNRIGSANFDIGHTFSTGGGGLASLGVVCNNTRKASGITGSPSPVGDAYDIDFVAHEMGHQFGGDHTFNSSTSSCGGGNRSATEAYEVGSGTTIMGYAGICGSDDIQPHNDPTFHAISFDEISSYVAAGGAACGVVTSTGNTLPVITSMDNSGVTIPISTPFTLTGAATDADNDPLTYCWEEWDLGASTTWNGGNANTTSPLMKSRLPKTTGSRTFPDYRVIAANYPANPTAAMDGLKGETLPNRIRSMKFRLTVRDNKAGGGGVVSGGSGCQTGFTTPFTINIAGTTPFAVTYPNGGESFIGGSSATVTWNVASTNASPFNTTKVKISISTDGGLTFPFVLLDSTDNDGTESVVMPAVVTTTARIKVEAIGNIFFDISNANFSITQTAADFSFNTTTPAVITFGTSNSTTISLGTSFTGGFSTIINLLIIGGVPSGAVISFNPNAILPGSSTNVTISNISGLAAGTYNVVVNGVAGSISHTTLLTLIINRSTFCDSVKIFNNDTTICSGSNLRLTAGESINTSALVARDIDGNTYPTVNINSQIWSKKNLNVSHFKNGDIIPQVTNSTQWANLSTGAWCWYNNDSATNAATYGKLYNWYAVNDTRGIAPSGWHIPTNQEFNILISYLGGLSVAGGKMKEAGNIHWASPNLGATNSSGFNGFPGADRNYFGTFDGQIGKIGAWWSSTESATSSTFAWQRTLLSDSNSVSFSGLGKGTGLSLRLLRNPITYLWSTGATTSSINVTPTQTTTYYCTITNGVDTCRDSILVIVRPHPFANFTFSINCGRKLSFTSTSTTASGTITDYQWNFGGTGNDNTSNLQNPIHNYPNTPSTYQVKLIITNSYGCKDTVIKSISTGISPIPDLISDSLITNIDGIQYFYTCSSNGLFSFYNNSQNYNSNTTYTINWGDGTSGSYNESTFPAQGTIQIPHTYSQGTYNLVFIQNNNDGCIDSAIYKVFFGSVPAGALGSDVSTTICTGSNQSVIISNTATNTQGTLYTLYFNDGSDTIRLIQPISNPYYLPHTFDSASCGTNSSNGGGTLQNSFAAYLKIQNPCGTRLFSVFPIYVASKPKADFTISPYDTICVGQTLTLTNTGDPGQDVNSLDGTCTPGKSVWQITPNTPGTRYQVSSGSLGVTSAAPNNPANWTSGTNTVNVRFDSAGIYTIKIISANTASCSGKDTMIKTICVNPLPTAQFTLTSDSGCAPLSVFVSGSTNLANCDQNTFNYSVTYIPTSGCSASTSDYAYIDRTNSASQNPHFNFVNPGQYIISLQTSAPYNRCQSLVFKDTVKVKGTPVVSILGVPSTVCVGQSIIPISNSSCDITSTSSYSWSLPGGSPSSSNQASPGNITFSNSGNQSISLNVTNICGQNTASQSITINPQPIITGTTSVCVNVSTQLTGNSSGSWLSSNTSIATVNSSGLVTGVSSGSANITFINSNNCSSNITITVKATPTGSISPSSGILCTGSSITLTATGGTSYQWLRNGVTITGASASTYSATLSGTYTVTIFNNSCSASASNQAVLTSGIPSGTISPSSSVLCPGSSIVLTATGGTSYQWLRNGVLISGATASTYVATLIGTYSVTIFNNGCSASASNQSVITAGTIPTGTISPVSGVLCTGSSITLTANGGTSYQWLRNGVSISGATASTYVATLSGAYSVTIFNNGCSGSASNQAILTLGSPSGTISPSSFVLCPGNSIALTATGGTSYQWYRNGIAISGATTSTYVVTLSGTYSVTIFNNGCSVSASNQAVITAGTTPAGSISPSSAFLCTGSSIVLTATGGTSYQWLRNGIAITGATSSTYAATLSGTYTVAIFNNGCSGSASNQAVITAGTTPTGTISPVSGVLCTGSSIVLTATGGTSYQWFRNGVAISGAISSTYAATLSGTYSVTIFNNGCSASASNQTVITAGTAPTGSISPSSGILCTGSSIALTVNGGTSYQWFRNGVTIAGATASTYAATLSGTYTATIFNNGCSGSASNQATITSGVSPAGLISPVSGNICEGSSLALFVSGGASYQWYLNGSPITGVSGSTYAATIAGTYSVKIFGSNGCNAFAGNTSFLSVTQRPTASFSFDNYCINTPINFVNTSDTSNSTPVSYQWIFGDGSTSNIASPVHTFSSPANYNVNMTVRSVLCPSFISTITKTVSIAPFVPNQRYPSVNALANNSLTLNARIFNGAMYTWIPATGLNNSSINNPVFNYNQEQQYLIKIKAQSGCVITDTLKVNMFNQSDIFVPQGFSPNGDGKNDQLIPILVGMRELRTFQIYDRWGQRIFSTNIIGVGWDGKYRGVDQPIETYTWIAEGIGIGGNLVKRSGGVVLLR